MIVQYPDFPASAELMIPRPAVYLLGSYHPKRGAHGTWQPEIARRLLPVANAVFFGVNTGQHSRQHFVEWTFFWMNRADIVFGWVEDPHSWAEFELGYAVGALGAKVHLGAPTELGSLVDAFEAVSLAASHARRGKPTVYSDLNEMVVHVRQRLRQC